MKKLAVTAVVGALMLTLASPAMAGHRGPYRGRRVFARDRFAFVAPRPRAFVSLSFGFPVYAYPRYYVPAPVYYQPYPVVLAPPSCRTFWVPGHYIRDDGVRFWAEGHWSHEED
jgi:hypothetical protein